jgi:hypothetical protein
MRRRIAFANDFSLHPGIWLEIITGQNICRQMQLDAGSYWIWWGMDTNACQNGPA